MTIDLRHLRCFVAVAEDLHFHNAARRLGVAQPALSRTIKNLEGDLGVTLFLRSNRNVEITQAGRRFYEGCKEILGKTERVIEDVQRVHQGKIGTLRVGYTDNAMNGAAPVLLKNFQQTQPDIDLQLTHSVTATQLVELEEERIDFGFATGAMSPAGYDHVCIQKEHFVCIVYDGHRFATRDEVTLQELAQEPMIQGVRSEWEHFHADLYPIFRRAGFEPMIAQEGLTTSDIQRLVACGMGISVLTETVSETLAPGLKVVGLQDVVDQLSTMVLWKEDQQTAAKEHFIQFLRENAIAV